LGHILAQDLKKEWARITVLEGPVTDVWYPDSIQVIKFHYYSELAGLLYGELKKDYDIILHLAAVSDYQPKKPQASKISSDLKRLKLQLVPTEKLIDKIKPLSPQVILVGFKMEEKLKSRAWKARVSRLFQKAQCDLVVLNSLKENRYRGCIIDPTNRVLAQGENRQEIAKKLVDILKKKI